MHLLQIPLSTRLTQNYIGKEVLGNEVTTVTNLTQCKGHIRRCHYYSGFTKEEVRVGSGGGGGGGGEWHKEVK